jgi:hypothetical protein
MAVPVAAPDYLYFYDFIGKISRASVVTVCVAKRHTQDIVVCVTV